MKISKTLISYREGGSIYMCDTIEHEGKLWLVPHWLESPSEGTKQPTRIIRLDGLQYQRMTNPAYGADYILNEPLPKAVFEGPLPKELEGQYVAIERPDIPLPIPKGIH
jgi:hypothetical protein